MNSNLSFRIKLNQDNPVLKVPPHGGKKVLPWSMLLEAIIRYMDTKGFADRDWQFSHLQFVRPVEVGESELRLQVILNWNAGFWTVKARSKKEDEVLDSSSDWTDHLLAEVHKTEEKKLPSDSGKGNGIADALKLSIARALGKSVEQISEQTDFLELGLNSTDLLQLGQELEGKLNTKLYPTLLFEYTNIEQLAQYLTREFGDDALSADICLKTVQPTEAKDGEEDPSADLYFVPHWVTEKLPPRKAGLPLNALIIYPQQCFGLDELLAQALEGVQVYKVKLGTKSATTSEWEAEIAAEDPTALEYCLEQMPPVDTVYFLGGIQEQIASLDNLEAVAKSQELGVISLFRLMKALSQSGKLNQLRRLQIITNNVYQVRDEEAVEPMAAGLSGMVKSLTREYPRLEVSCLDLCRQDLEGCLTAKDFLAQKIFMEPAHKHAEDIAIRGNHRYKRVIRPLRLPAPPTSLFKREGVYLILGGAGGIGIELSAYLARHYQAKLILIGNGELSDQTNSRIAEIEAAGGKVLYIRADATVYEQMKRSVAKAKSMFGKIDGVIHSALVLKDMTIEMMEEDTLRAVLAPKVFGSAILYKVFAEEPPEFLLFFSSIQSFVGNHGQSNYAAACTFKDAFARAIADKCNWLVRDINWGYWGSVGVVATEEYNKRLASVGLKSIEPEEGIEAIERVLASRPEQVAVVKAEDYALKLIGVETNCVLEVVEEFVPSLIDPVLEEIQATIRQEQLTDVQLIRNMYEELAQFSSDLLLLSFQRMEIFLQGKESYKISDLEKNLGVSKVYHRLFDELMGILVRGGLLHRDGDYVTTDERLELKETQQRLQGLGQAKELLVAKYPELKAYVDLVWTCVTAYPEVLTGKKNYMTVMFPQGSTALVENIYKGNRFTDYYSQLVAKIVKALVIQRLATEPEAAIRILEVGAGTGSTTMFVLEALQQFKENITYYYTDIALEFTRHKDAQFRANYPFVKFKVLDIEKEPEQQGVPNHSIDIVFGSNVFHATKNIGRSLQQVKKLLKTNGLLIVNELTRLQDFVTLTFGMTTGWWLFEDEKNRIQGSPLLTPQQWAYAYEASGYKKIKVLGIPGIDVEEAPQNLILGESDGYRLILDERRKETSREASSKLILTNPREAQVDFVSGAKEIQILGVAGRAPDQRFSTHWKKLREGVPSTINDVDFHAHYMQLLRQHTDKMVHLLIHTGQGESSEVIVSGRGKTILLITGFGLTAPQWYYQIGAWSNNYQIVIIHAPGTGLSSGKTDLSFLGISKRFVEVLEQLQVTWPIHVVGTSLGGMIAQTLTGEYPDKVSSLTLASSLCKYQGDPKTNRELVNRDFEKVGDNSCYDLLMGSECLNSSVVNYTKYLEEGFSTEGLLPKIKVPTLIVCGTEDQVVDPQQSSYMHTKIIGSRYQALQGAGHFGNITHHEKFNALVMDFISEQDA